jgi:hypothetical protein
MKTSSIVRKNMIVLALSTALAVAPAMALNSNYDTAHAAPVIGTSAAVTGEVFVSTNGAERKAQIKQSIQLQDQVTTKQDSALQILLLDQSTFTVGQNCNMTIDRFVYDPSTETGEVGATVTQGAFRFMSGNIGKASPTSASVSTPTATIGIRGTFFEGIVGADALALAQLGGQDTSGASGKNASLIILRGPGPNSNTLDKQGFLKVSTAGGSSNISTPNFAVFDPGNGGAPSSPFVVTADMQQYLDFFLRSSPNGPSENPIPVSEEVEQESGQDKFELPVTTNEDIYEDLIDGIQDSLTDQFCSDLYGGFSAC